MVKFSIKKSSISAGNLFLVHDHAILVIFFCINFIVKNQLKKNKRTHYTGTDLLIAAGGEQVTERGVQPAVVPRGRPHAPQLSFQVSPRSEWLYNTYLLLGLLSDFHKNYFLVMKTLNIF